MNYGDIAFKAGTLLAGAIGAWKLIVEFLRGRHGHLREEYKFARDFLADLAKTPHMHPFLKQKGYQAIAGDTSLSGAEIEYLLTLNDSALALRNYVLGRGYLDYLVTATGRQLVFKPKFEGRWSRWWRKVWYLTLYAALYSAGVAPIFLPAFKHAPIEYMTAVFAATAAFFFPAAFFALKAGVRIARAEALLKSQNKQTDPIVTSARKF